MDSEVPAPGQADEHEHDHEHPRPTTVAVVLAAGAGSRFAGSGHKLDATVDGRPIGATAIAAAAASGIGQVVVVTGHHDLSALPPDLRATVDLVHNPDWAGGQLTSLRRGLAAAARLGASAVVVGLADQPFVSPAAWRAVAASTSPIAVATYDGTRGNPVRLHASVWPLLDEPALAGADEGARSLIRLRPDLVEAVPCPGSAADIDTLEDLERWQSKS